MGLPELRRRRMGRRVNEQHPEINVGQKWKRKRDGRIFTVLSIGTNYVEISDGENWPVVPWVKTFLRNYERGEE